MTTQERIDKMLKKSEAILNAGKQTNEEWFCGLSTEEKAKVIVDLGRKQHFPKDIEIEICEQWLKEMHKE